MPDLQTTSQSPLSLSVVLFFSFFKISVMTRPDLRENDCGEDGCGEGDCGDEMPEPQTTSQSPSFCSCCQSSQVSFLLSGATSSNSNSLRRFLDVSKLAVECMKGW